MDGRRTALALREDEIEAAIASVGHSAAARARWLRAFAARDLKNLTPYQRRILQLEVDFFIVSETPGGTRRLPGGPASIHFPAAECSRITPMNGEDRIRRWHRWLRTGIAELMRGEVWRIPIGVMHQLGVGSFLSRGITRSTSDIFKIGTVEAFKEEWSRFRLCERCRMAFIAQKRQAYCTPRCSQAVRTKRYRSKDPERVRLLRLASYARIQREKYGANVTIARRPLADVPARTNFRASPRCARPTGLDPI